MKYTRLILTFVTSSLFISSIKLEAMETVRRTSSRRMGIRGLSKPPRFLANSKNLTNNKLENLIISPTRSPYQIDLVSHHNSANPVWTKKLAKAKKKTVTPHKFFKRRKIRLECQQTLTETRLRQNSKTWIRRLVERSLIDQNNTLQDSNQITQLKSMKRLLDNSRIICIGPLNTSSGADILSSLIAQTK